MKNLEKILEGLLFISGDGLDKGYIMEKLSLTEKEIDGAVEKLKEKYNEDSGIQLLTYKHKIQFCSNPNYADEISTVLNPIRERNLSKSTLEVCAIVCYKQPVTRLEIEEIRGVNSDYAIQTLIDHNIIEVVGRKDAVGKPLLFGTTDNFLKRFQISDINELPDYEEILKQVETIESENHLYNEFEIHDEDGLTEEERKEANFKAMMERKEQQEKDDKLIEELVATQKELESVNKRVQEYAENERNGGEAKVESEVASVSSEDSETVEDEIPDFLKDLKDVQVID